MQIKYVASILNYKILQSFFVILSLSQPVLYAIYMYTYMYIYANARYKTCSSSVGGLFLPFCLLPKASSPQPRLPLFVYKLLRIFVHTLTAHFCLPYLFAAQSQSKQPLCDVSFSDVSFVMYLFLMSFCDVSFF